MEGSRFAVRDRCFRKVCPRQEANPAGGWSEILSISTDKRDCEVTNAACLLD